MKSNWEILTTVTLVLNKKDACWIKNLCINTEPQPTTIDDAGNTTGGELREHAIIRANLIHHLQERKQGWLPKEAKDGK